MCIVGLVHELEPPAVTQKVFKLGRYASAKVLRARIALLALETLVCGIAFGDPVSCPAEPARSQEVDEHEGEGFHVIAPRGH